MVYDWGDDYKIKEIDQYWLDSVSPELRERLMTIPERQEQMDRETGRSPKEATGNPDKIIRPTGGEDL